MTTTTTTTTTTAAIEVGAYVLAEVVGFSVTTIRARVTRIEPAADCVFIITADLCDAGTRLVLPFAKVAAFEPAL